MPKRLLLDWPLSSCGTLVPQFVSSAACAMRLRGSIPSCRPASWAAGHMSLMKLAFVSGEAGVVGVPCAADVAPVSLNRRKPAAFELLVPWEALDCAASVVAWLVPVLP